MLVGGEVAVGLVAPAAGGGGGGAILRRCGATTGEICAGGRWQLNAGAAGTTESVHKWTFLGWRRWQVVKHRTA